MEEALKHQQKAFEDACRRVGLRVTPQRVEVFRELANASDHPSAEVLYGRLLEKMATLSLDTVYRTLGAFVEHGLVNKVVTVESQARFEIAQRQHHHLICRMCKQIVDFQWQLIDQAGLPDAVKDWGRIERKSLVAYGECRSCQERS